MSLLNKNYIKDFLLAGNSLSDLNRELGVRHRRHRQFENLILFKYNNIVSDFSNPIVRQSRGIVLDQDNGYEVVAYPFDKFFNYGEPLADDIDWSSARVYEKLDGTMISLYYYGGKWNVGTTGTPDGSAPVDEHPNNFTFYDLFIETFWNLEYDLPKDTGLTYVFELMTPFNRIVVDHKEQRLVLIGVRENKPPYRELPPEPIAEKYGWECVRSFPLRTMDDVLEAAKSLDFKKQEGFVVVDKHFNRVKVKSPAYVAAHRVRFSITSRNALSAVLSGDDEEYMLYFPEYEPEFRRAREKLMKFSEITEKIIEKMSKFDNFKDIALRLGDHPAKHVVLNVLRGKVGSPEEYLTNISARNAINLIEKTINQGEKI